MPRLPPLREKMAVLMPTRWPAASTSAPPELPGLMAASVWMKFWNCEAPACVRSSALTMPAVTVCPTLKGLPMASTASPTCSARTLPSVTTGRLGSSILSTAMSVSGSLPTTVARVLRPSASWTSMSVAPATTWWLVSR